MVFIIILILTSQFIEGQEESCVSIYEGSTRFEIRTPIINQSVKLSVAIRNNCKNDTKISLNVKSDHLEITPKENKTAVIPGSKITSFDYYVISNVSGEFQININLYRDNELVDFHTLSIEYQKEQTPIILSLNHLILLIVYVSALFLAYLAFLKFLVVGIDTKGWIVLIGIFWFIIYLALRAYSEIPEDFIISQINKVYPILAIIAILSVSLFFMLLLQQKRYGFIMGSVTIYLITLSLIFDWIVPQNLTTHLNLLGIFSSSIIGYIIDKVLKSISKKKLL